MFASPAKLNLFFRVVSKRPDGYHNIASLFQAVDLCDRLFFTPSSHDLLTCTDPSIPCDASNLVSKALNLFRSWFPIPPVSIHIEKRIPTQAGFGGGSSNAATTLWALNQLHGSPATLSQLIEMGSQIGSDVAFFFSSGTAYCTGRGEILEPRSLPSPLKGWLAKPSYGLSTPLVYRHTRLEALPSRDLSALYYNDLEIPAFQLEPRLIALKQSLIDQGYAHVTMTGSGTAFFFFGEHAPASLDGVTFYSFRSVIRTDSWYDL